jgi:hypothetical protein
MPAPWIQVNLLQVLAILGTADKTASEGMYEMLHEVMKRADIGINVGFAILYEVIHPDGAARSLRMRARSASAPLPPSTRTMR